jgi:hypothetical protein
VPGFFFLQSRSSAAAAYEILAHPYFHGVAIRRYATRRAYAFGDDRDDSEADCCPASLLK